MLSKPTFLISLFFCAVLQVGVVATAQAVEGPAFEPTINWIRDTLKTKPAVACKIKDSSAGGPKQECHSFSLQIRSDCTAEVRIQRDYDDWERRWGSGLSKRYDSVITIPNFGFIEVAHSNPTRFLPFRKYSLSQNASRDFSSNTGPGAVRGDRWTLKAKSGGVMENVFSDIHRSWSYQDMEMSFPKRVSNVRKNENRVEMYGAYGSDLGKRLTKALNKYAEHCRAKYPQAPSLF